MCYWSGVLSGVVCQEFQQFCLLFSYRIAELLNWNNNYVTCAKSNRKFQMNYFARLKILYDGDDWSQSWFYNWVFHS